MTREQLWERLEDPSRRIFHLPKSAEPLPRLSFSRAEFEDRRDSHAKLRPLRIGASILGGGLMVAAGTLLATQLSVNQQQGVNLLPNLHLGSLIALPLIPLAVTFYGDRVQGHGTWISSLAGTLVGYFGAFLLFTFATELRGSDHYVLPNMSPIRYRERGAGQVVIDERIGTTAAGFVPFLAAAPILGAVIGYELSSQARLAAPIGPNHPLMQPRGGASHAFSF